MPVADDPERPSGSVLLDEAGVVLARFEEVQREHRRVADRFSLIAGVSPQQAVPVVMTALSGWRIAAEEPFGRLLVEAGGRPARHGHVLSRDLVRDPVPRDWLEPPLPAGIRLTAVDRPALELVEACDAAYPREHPDFDHIPSGERPDLRSELEALIAGSLLGPLLRCSSLAVGEEGDVLGAVLVNGMSGEPPFGGPWIAQLFRHPGARGAGSALLRRALALAARDGLPAIGLAVTHNNPALGLYEAHGFAEVLDSLTVDL